MVITPWFIDWSNGVLPVADYDFSIGSWELLIKLGAGGITLNKEKLEVHGLFLTVFPKIWHHVVTLSICVVTWTFQLSLWLVGKTSKNLLWPWGFTAFHELWYALACILLSHCHPAEGSNCLSAAFKPKAVSSSLPPIWIVHPPCSRQKLCLI